MRPVDETRFRAAMGSFATGVCVIAVRSADGTPVGFTATSLASVSLDPPLVLFCLGREAAVLPVFEQAAGFGVSMLAAGQDELAALFAVEPTLGFMKNGWDEGPNGAPLLQGRVGGLTCDVERVDDGGDHRIFVGRVLGADSDATAEPLTYFRGRYRGLSG